MPQTICQLQERSGTHTHMLNVFQPNNYPSHIFLVLFCLLLLSACQPLVTTPFAYVCFSCVVVTIMLVFPLLFCVCRWFDFAFEVSKVALKSKVPEIHLKKALYLEDEVNWVVITELTKRTMCRSPFQRSQLIHAFVPLLPKNSLLCACALGKVRRG